MKRTFFVALTVMSLFCATFGFLNSAGTIAYALQSRLHTEGRFIKDSTGNTIILKGAALFWRFAYCSSQTTYNPLAYTDEISESSLNVLKSTGANFVRLTVNGYLWYVAKKPAYIQAVDTVVSWCKARGIWVVLDNHNWQNPDRGSLYKSKLQLITQLNEWKGFMVGLAQRYINEPTVIGFDTFNEPSSEGTIDWTVWRTNVLSVVKAIHAVNSEYLCFVEPLGSCADYNDMQNLKDNPLPEPNIIYSAHNYYSWDYPWYDYAKNYGAGNFALAAQQMEKLYYQRWIHMIEAKLPVANMETGVYRDVQARNPNWRQWMIDSLALYDKYGVSYSWNTFDPDRIGSSLLSMLKADRTSLTDVGLTASYYYNQNKYVPLFSDGFESGDFTAWKSTEISASCTLTVDSTDSHHGTTSAKSYLNGGTTGQRTRMIKDVTPGTTCYTRAYVKLLTNLPASGSSFRPLWAGTTGTIELVSCAVLNEAGTLKWAMSYRRGGGTGQISTATNAPVLNRWYCIEIKVVIAAGNGEAHLYIDGTELLSATGLTNNDLGNVARVLAGECYSNGATQHTILTDCFVVANTYIGPEV